ncbi:MAG: hypothetical protein U0441_01170 [Polyangiaceae bacterium]
MSNDLAALVQQDLSAFCDVGSELNIAAGDGSARFRFNRGGTSFSGRASWANGTVDYAFTGFPNVQLRELLASTAFCDFDGFVRNQLLAHRDVENDFPFRHVEIDGTKELGVEALLERLSERQRGELLLLVIDGPAGVGKTRLIKRICLAHASDFRARRPGAAPTLYVGSRGRRLSRLDDAIAASLQDVRARAVYTEVPALVRSGALSVAIDGFDELANPEGYAVAWRTFNDFVRELGGVGTLVISARDTFFDAQDFTQKIETVRQLGRPLRVINARVREPRWRYAREYLKTRAAANDEALGKLEALIEPAKRPYALRPVFLDAFRIQVSEGFETETPFRGLLVQSFVQREASEKLLPAGHIMSGPVRNALMNTLQEIAADMQERDRDWVDPETLELLLQLHLETATELSRDEVSAIVARASSLGFMEQGGADSKDRRFPHEEIRFWFLAGHLIELMSITSLDSLRTTLEKGTIGLDLVDVLVERLNENTVFPYDAALGRLATLAKNSQDRSTLGANVRALLAGILRARPLADLPPVQLANLRLGNASLEGSRLIGVLTRCQFDQLNLESADCSALRFEDCGIRTLIVNSDTTLGTSLPDASMLRVMGDDGEVRITEPGERDLYLRSLISERALHTLPLVRLLERTCRRLNGQFYIADDPRDNRASDIVGDPLWPQLKELLKEHELMDTTVKPTSGNRKNLFRIKDPVALLTRSTRESSGGERIKAFWTALVQRAL